MQRVRWAAIVDGVLHKGEGTIPGLNRAILPRASAAVLVSDGLPPLFISGPSLLEWEVEIEICDGRSSEVRWWGLQTREGDRVWLWPDGSLVGVGPTVDDVAAAAASLQVHLGIPGVNNAAHS